MRVIQDNQTIEWEANAPFLEKYPEVPMQITSADGLILNGALYPIDISKETPQSRKPQQCICKILQMHRAHYPAVIF